MTWRDDRTGEPDVSYVTIFEVKDLGERRPSDCYGLSRLTFVNDLRPSVLTLVLVEGGETDKGRTSVQGLLD